MLLMREFVRLSGEVAGIHNSSFETLTEFVGNFVMWMEYQLVKLERTMDEIS